MLASKSFGTPKLNLFLSDHRRWLRARADLKSTEDEKMSAGFEMSTQLSTLWIKSTTLEQKQSDSNGNRTDAESPYDILTSHRKK